MTNFIFGSSPNSAWKRPKFVSHAGHSFARQLFDEMSQQVTRVQCVSTMQEHRVPSSLLHTDACACPPEWMASSPLLPSVLSCLALARHRENAAASAMADGPSSHLPQCSLLRAFSAQPNHLSASAASCCASRARSAEVEARRSSRPPVTPAVADVCTWPGHHEPCPVHPRRPADPR